MKQDKRTERCVCKICGFVTTGRGIGPHMLKHKKEKRAYKKRASAPQEGDTKTLLVPCSLGGHNFDVKVVIQITSVSLVDAQ